MGYLLGIIGKPNVGKSTFFTAVTLAQAQIANYPFTTIEPNKGIGYVRINCVCKEFGVKDEPINSICINGARLIPVEIVDCAGLVPGAWEGKGLGNKFLDEIRMADVLIHIVDASGATDIEGKICKPGEHDPIEDIKFLEREIDMWLLRIIKKDWDRLIRRAEGVEKNLVDGLEKILSGLAIKRNDVADAIKKTQLEIKSPKNIDDERLLDFIHLLREISKPILIVANKIDVPEAEDNLNRLKKEGYQTIPCCAEAELALRRASNKKIINYVPGEKDFEIINPGILTEDQNSALLRIKNDILKKFGTTGVQKSINTAYFDLLEMIAVYPVVDADKLTDHKDKILPDVYLIKKGTNARQLAYMIHTDLGKSFIYAVDARRKMRIGEDHSVENNDVISIVSSERRGA